MRIVILCGNQSNQHALAVKAAQQFELAGIVLETRKVKRKKSLSFLLSKIADRLLFKKIGQSWQAMLLHYNNSPASITSFKTLHTDNVNSPAVIDFITSLQPELIMVSGTSLLKEELLKLKPAKGIVNLHTGLSPYVKGGPNCTNWCISNHTMHLVGNTIMWIDRGIDSGNIITTETVALTGEESLSELHIKVMEHAHNLYLRALQVIDKNYENCPSVKQADIAKGELYLTKMWDFKAKLRFVRNVSAGKYREEIKSENYDKRRRTLKLIALPD